MVTIKEIAEKAGVAKSTISNVLSGNKYVSPEIKEKVLKICKDLDYKPNFYATLLSTKTKTNIVGLFLEESEKTKFQNFYSALIESCINTLSKYDNNLLVYSGLNTEDTTVKLTTGKSPIDGAIILSPTFNDKRLLKIRNNMLPVVTIGRASGLTNISSIDVDNRLLVENIATELCEKNYKKICLINSHEQLIISKERDEGLLNALKEKEFKYKIVHTSSTKEEGYEACLKALNEGYDAFITANEEVALGVYAACKNLDKEISKDVAVFSLGCNPEKINQFKPSLSYAYQDYYVLGLKACEILMKIINGNEKTINEVIESEMHYQESFNLTMRSKRD